MLGDLILALLTAGDAAEKKKVYRRLERLGVDQATADMIAAEYYQPEVKANA